MAKKIDGRFTGNFFSLQLQLKTLLQEAGGDTALELLDRLCELKAAEQKILLKVFSRMLDKIISAEHDHGTEGDLALKRFEESAETELIAELKRAVEETPGLSKPRLEVVSPVKRKSIIDLAQARKERKQNEKPVVN